MSDIEELEDKLKDLEIKISDALIRIDQLEEEVRDLRYNGFKNNPNY